MKRQETPDDSAIEKELSELRDSIRKWIRLKDPHFDFSFTTWEKHFSYDPAPAECLLILTYDHYLDNDQDWLEALAADVLEPNLLWGESYSSSCFFIYVDEEHPRFNHFWLRNKWRWMLHMIEGGYQDLNAEIYSHLGKRPELLHQIGHRPFELFLGSVFRNQGYEAIVTPGSGDGGVDIRLFHHDAIYEAPVLVQVKRYSQHRPIELEAVAALLGVVVHEDAKSGVFVTTSRYLPGARRFAESAPRGLLLADSRDMIEWFKDSGERLKAKCAHLADPVRLRSELSSLRTRLAPGKIYSASVGVTMTMNSFAIKVAAAGKVAVFVDLPRKVVDGDMNCGLEVPDFSLPDSWLQRGKPPFRGFRKDELGLPPHFWADGHHWHEWDGRPIFFNHHD